MACIGRDKNGTKRILFVDGSGKRRTIRLGRVGDRDAERILHHVEVLSAAKIRGASIGRETAVWVANVGDTLHDRLSRAGLVEPRQAVKSVLAADFIDGYIESRKDLKPATATVLTQCRVWLLRFLGEGTRMDAVTVKDADAYHAHMFASGLAKATIAKRCRYARHFFEVAKRRGIIAHNPFGHIKAVVTGDPSRRVFVPGDVVAKVMDAIPDPQWKLLLALARWGGLRIPSEALALTWGDVDFAGKRFIVRASKTAHHKDGGIRIVPMFPELADLFQRVFDEAEEGTVHVITRYRHASVNLRTQLLKYIARAKVKPWPKLWQNLRASRATELADLYPSHVCAAWLGHTEKIADTFYRTVTDSHFMRATEAPTPGSIRNPAQNPAQQAPEMTRTIQRQENEESCKSSICGDLRDTAESGEHLSKPSLGVTGLEPVTLRV